MPPMTLALADKISDALRKQHYLVQKPMPTVYQAACSRLSRINHQIAELSEEKKSVIQRMEKYRDSNTLESERLATKAEPYQQEGL